MTLRRLHAPIFALCLLSSCSSFECPAQPIFNAERSIREQIDAAEEIFVATVVREQVCARLFYSSGEAMRQVRAEVEVKQVLRGDSHLDCPRTILHHRLANTPGSLPLSPTLGIGMDYLILAVRREGELRLGSDRPDASLHLYSYREVVPGPADSIYQAVAGLLLENSIHVQAAQTWNAIQRLPAVLCPLVEEREIAELASLALARQSRAGLIARLTRSPLRCAPAPVPPSI